MGLPGMVTNSDRWVFRVAGFLILLEHANPVFGYLFASRWIGDYGGLFPGWHIRIMGGLLLFRSLIVTSICLSLLVSLLCLFTRIKELRTLILPEFLIQLLYFGLLFFVAELNVDAQYFLGFLVVRGFLIYIVFIKAVRPKVL